MNEEELANISRAPVAASMGDDGDLGGDDGAESSDNDGE
jgi:hypothetical protein